MTCPKPEVLSQWADGSLDARESLAVGRHAEACPACRRKAEDLRAVGNWISSARQPGPACLSADDMAAVLEGGRVPSHVRTCPRCASEFRALRSAERKATRRRLQPQPQTPTAWVAAAAIFIAVGILIFMASQQKTDRPVRETVQAPIRETPETPAPETPRVTPPAPVLPKPPAPERRETVRLDPPVPPPEAPKTSETPVPPNPVAEQPRPETPKPLVPEPPSTTRVEPPRALASINVRSGALASLADGKWVKATRIEEGMALRAEGRTQVDFAQARITLEGASRFSVTKDDFSLNEGTMAAEVATGSKFALVLDEQRVVPQTFSGRVMFTARPDRILVEEGSAKVKDLLIHEGVEHTVKKDRIEAQKRRSLPAAARSRETITWRMNLSNANTAKRNVTGHFERETPEGRMLVSDPSPGNGVFYGAASYFSTGDEPNLFTVKPNTAIRFRYYLPQPAYLEFVMKNATKDENFNKPLEPVVRQWTTVTIYASDVPPNMGGKKVTCDVGDQYRGVTWFVGKPGSPAEVYIDRFEILEIER